MTDFISPSSPFHTLHIGLTFNDDLYKYFGVVNGMPVAQRRDHLLRLSQFLHQSTAVDVSHTIVRQRDR